MDGRRKRPGLDVRLGYLCTATIGSRIKNNYMQKTQTPNNNSNNINIKTMIVDVVVFQKQKKVDQGCRRYVVVWVYGYDSILQSLDVFEPPGGVVCSSTTTQIVWFVCGGAWIIGHKMCGALLARVLTRRA
jgi:hypothetical protein